MWVWSVQHRGLLQGWVCQVEGGELLPLRQHGRPHPGREAVSPGGPQFRIQGHVRRAPEPEDGVPGLDPGRDVPPAAQGLLAVPGRDGPRLLRRPMWDARG